MEQELNDFFEELKKDSEEAAPNLCDNVTIAAAKVIAAGVRLGNPDLITVTDELWLKIPSSARASMTILMADAILQWSKEDGQDNF